MLVKKQPQHNVHEHLSKCALRDNLVIKSKHVTGKVCHQYTNTIGMISLDNMAQMQTDSQS